MDMWTTQERCPHAHSLNNKYKSQTISQRLNRPQILPRRQLIRPSQMNDNHDHVGGQSPKSQRRRVELRLIIVDPLIQQRCKTSKKVVSEYAQAMRDDANFPPLTVFCSDGDYILADGFTRKKAQEKAHPNNTHIECEVLPGDRDDALLFACGANATHGMPRTNADKRKAVKTLLGCEKWSNWSDRQIAQQCNVSHPFVAKIRRRLETFPGADPSGQKASRPSVPDVTATGKPNRARTAKRSGTSYTLQSEDIGGRRRGTQSRQKGPQPFLAPHAWWLASKDERLKFVREIGGPELLKTLKEAEPSFDILAFTKMHCEEINAIAVESEPSPVAEPPSDPQPVGV